MFVDPIINGSWEHFQIFLSGATVLGIVAHMVQTFPTPNNKYGQWLLGSIQYIVGQRLRAANTVAGEETLTKQVPLSTKNPAPNKDSIDFSNDTSNHNKPS